MHGQKTDEPRAAAEQRYPDENKMRCLTAPLPDLIGQNIDAVTALHAKAEQDLDRHQRVVELVTES